jgi:ElaA protein
MSDCSVEAKPWSELTTTELYSILKLRTDVFFLEQQIDEEELDYRDLEPTTTHYWIEDASHHAIAYLRVLRDPVATHLDANHVIGRVVVRADHRGEGLAQELLAKALERLEGQAVLLHAQEYIAPLYAKAGFEAFGEVYLEAGIQHISMYRAPGTHSL